jgi:Asp-tRNA(Asn)/Glu-tRNA(Gln) amidotransferase C subunit
METRQKFFLSQIPQPTGMNFVLNRCISSAVYNEIRKDHTAPDRLRQAVLDNLNQQAQSFANVPEFIQRILSLPEKYQSLFLGLSTDQMTTAICETMTSAIDEFEQCLEETILVFEARLKEALATWLNEHEVATLEAALDQELNNIKPRYNGLPFLNDFLLRPTMMGGARGYVLTETHAEKLIIKVMREMLDEIRAKEISKNELTSYKP